MKKLFSILLISAFASTIGFSQISKDEFEDAEVTWYGLDFTKAKMVGSAGFQDAEVIRNDFFEKWNSLILVEADKYDLKGAFRKPDLKYDLEMIKDINNNVEYKDLVMDKSHSITKDDVAAAVKNYKLDQKNGYGISFVVESFDKINEKAVVWVTIFDPATKKVLLTEKLEGKPGGFGLRNYWAGAINKIIQEIDKVKYKSWIR